MDEGDDDRAMVPALDRHLCEDKADYGYRELDVWHRREIQNQMVWQQTVSDTNEKWRFDSLILLVFRISVKHP